jgi:hypothetical protein
VGLICQQRPFAVEGDDSRHAWGQAVLSSNDAEALKQAVGVKTIRDLAENRYIRRAQAIVHLADGSR